jgi:hypothetical protein
MAEILAGFARAGISHIQAVLDPIDAGSIEELGEVVALLS